MGEGVFLAYALGRSAFTGLGAGAPAALAILGGVIELLSFAESDFPEYQAWYLDAALNQALGPMDEEWLAAVLAEVPPAQFSLWVDGELSAVCGIVRGEGAEADWVVTDLAVRPDLRGRGLGRLALIEILRREYAPGRTWSAYVEPGNVPAQRFFASLGWSDGGRDASGMWVFRHRSK